MLKIWEELWREIRHGGWATLIALILIMIWHCCKRFYFRYSSLSNPTTPISETSRIHSQFRYFFLGFLWFQLCHSSFSSILVLYVKFEWSAFHKVLFLFFKNLEFYNQSRLKLGPWWFLQFGTCSLKLMRNFVTGFSETWFCCFFFYFGFILTIGEYWITLSSIYCLSIEI